MGYFLTVAQVERLHRRCLEEHGGQDGVRDRGLLEAAVATPRATFDGKLLHETIHDQAAAYFYHLCRNHAFVDGNKRVAVAAALVFLRCCDVRVTATDEQLEELTWAASRGEIDKSELAQFLAKHSLGGETFSDPPT